MSGRAAPLPPGFSALWGTVALDLVGFGIVAPILPLYAQRFHATPATIGLLMATYSLAQVALSPVLGRLSDRVGRRPILLVSLCGTAVTSLMIGLAGSLWLLFVARALNGASGASVSVAQASVLDVAEPGERARLLGFLGAAFGVGFVAGPVIASLSALTGPRVPFLVAAALAGFNVVLALRRLPETHPASGAARSASSPPARPSRPAAGWRQRQLGGLVLVSFLSMVAFSAFEATFALLGQRRLGFGLASTGAVFIFVGVLVAVVQVGLVRPAVSRWGEVGALRLGLVAEFVGLGLLAGVHSLAALFPVLALLTVGQGLIVPTLTALLGSRVEAGRRGGVLGVQQASSGTARIIGPALGGAALGAWGAGAPYLLGSAVVLVAALWSVRLDEPVGSLVVTEQ